MLRFRRNRLFFRIARILAMFVLGLFVAVFIALSQINLESLRSNLVSVLQDSTGLPVEIDGGISWKFSLRPKVVLNNVRIKNADWAKNKDGFHAKKIYVTLDLISLFRNKTTIDSLKISDANLFIEKNENGEYSIMPKHVDSETENKINDFPFDLDVGMESIELNNISAKIDESSYFISGLHIKYDDKGNTREYSGWLKSESKIYPFIISLSKYNFDRKIYPVRIALSTGGEALLVNIALEGTSKMPIDFYATGNISDLNQLGNVFGLDLPQVSSLRVDIAGGVQHKKLILRKSNLYFRNSELNISGKYDWSNTIDNIDLNITSKKINLKELFPEIYEPGPKWVRPNRELNVFKDTPVFTEYLSKYNIKLSVNIDELTVYRDLKLKNIDIHAKLEKSNLRADLNTGIANGSINVAADAKLLDDGKLIAKVGAIGEKIYVGEVMKEVRENEVISELPVNFEFYFQAKGGNLSELMSTISGPFYLYSADVGYAHSDLVSYIYGTDFLTDLRHNVQDLFSSKKKNNQIQISCAAINLKLRDGRVETKNGIAIETNAINMRLVGNADLGAEKVKASLITVPVRGLKFSLTGNVVNSTEFNGNMAEPDIKINGAALAGKVASATGVGLLLAPFTGGISLVAGAGVGFLAGDLLENWLSDNHPCRTAMEQGSPENKDDPEWLKQSAKKLAENIIKQKG